MPALKTIQGLKITVILVIKINCRFYTDGAML